jgi:hypothetical protein
MGQFAWKTEHSVTAEVPAIFAWNYWTDHGNGVGNWNDPPAQFRLEGPFRFGSRGTTLTPGNPPMKWVIRDCHAPATATIEMQLEKATMAFQWQFEPLGDGRTRLTQRIVLRGDNAAAYLEQVESVFKSTLDSGMKKIASLMGAEYIRQSESRCGEGD